MVRVAAEDAGLEEDSRVIPDVVYNRFGSIYGRYTLLELVADGASRFVPLYVEGHEAKLGLYLAKISPAELSHLCAFVFAHFPIRRISWEYSTAPIGRRYICRNHPTNHWKVELPPSPDELWARMSRKSRYNRRREEKLLSEHLGGIELAFNEYEGNAIPPSVVEAFFSYKKQLMGREYGMTPAEYRSHYQVTNAYTWTAGERLVAIVFSCEQGQDVFLENLTYEPELEEFSPGFHLYALVLERLIAKGKSAVFLGGGQQPYKSRFGGTEDSCYNVEVFRSPVAALPYYAAKLLARLAPRIPGLSKPGAFFRRGWRFVRVRAKWAVQKLFFSLVPIGKALNDSPRPFSITVSLTSFPPRLATLHLCIKSLMRQTMKPDRIVLYLGADCDGIPLPRQLKALQRKGLTIRCVGGDLRPHKKYIYAMQEFPDDFIVTADDDLMYRRDMIESLWKAHIARPDALIASRVHLMRQKGGRILPYREWEQETGSVREPTHALLSTNGAGSLFPPHCLPPEALDAQLAGKLCLCADDIWLKFMLIRGGTKVLWAGKKAGMPDEIRIKAEKKKALMDGNMTAGGNDSYISAMESYFKMNLADYC